MPPSHPPPPPTNEFHVRIARDIERHGWTVTAVMPTEDHPGTPFAYTVGLYRTFDHPELVIVGWDGVAAHAVLSELIEQIEGGESFAPDRLYEDLFPSANEERAGYNGWFRTVSPANRDEYLTVARRWNGHAGESGVVAEPFPALQVIWPDPRNVFPWESAYDRRFPQPLMDERVQL